MKKEDHKQEAIDMMIQLGINAVYRCGDGLWLTDEDRAKQHSQLCGTDYKKYSR